MKLVEFKFSRKPELKSKFEFGLSNSNLSIKGKEILKENRIRFSFKVP